MDRFMDQTYFQIKKINQFLTIKQLLKIDLDRESEESNLPVNPHVSLNKSQLVANQISS